MPAQEVATDYLLSAKSDWSRESAVVELRRPDPCRSWSQERLSFVTPMKTSPPPVAMLPQRLMRPVFCLAAGSSLVMPNTVCKTIPPVLALIAVRLFHGGF